eukprot:TRINITY_DN8482_c0_g1_i1.p1 TRINITY_DN8482_c0_g1~~TRINITY_DN8482_c0_g1_i1.p1  ORF type:complete len:289 (+),score=34.32 TRINITY_DN8482_c0_g1_i1:62-928(+)
MDRTGLEVAAFVFPQADANNVLVTGLHVSVNYWHIRSTFQRFGCIVEIQLRNALQCTDRDEHAEAAYAFVKFLFPSEARRAVAFSATNNQCLLRKHFKTQQAHRNSAVGEARPLPLNACFGALRHYFGFDGFQSEVTCSTLAPLEALASNSPRPIETGSTVDTCCQIILEVADVVAVGTVTAPCLLQAYQQLKGADYSTLLLQNSSERMQLSRLAASLAYMNAFNQLRIVSFNDKRGVAACVVEAARDRLASDVAHTLDIIHNDAPLDYELLPGELKPGSCYPNHADN